MTWKEWMTKYLTDRGLWPEEAEAVISKYTNEGGTGDSMSDRLRDHAELPQMRAVIALALNSEARDWIDANKPNHFARQNFYRLTPPGLDGGRMETSDAS